MKIKDLFYFDMVINVFMVIAVSDLFEYLSYVSTIISNICILSVRGSSLDVRIGRLQTSDSDVQSRSPHCKG